MQQLDLDSRERYIIDTSSLVDVVNQKDPTKIWKGLFGLIQEGRLLTVGYVFPELERMVEAKKLPEAIWMQLKEFKSLMMIPDEEIISEAGRVNHKYPRLGDWRDKRNRADPWLVAAGKVRGYTVVTEESDVGAQKTHKIPWACDQEKVTWIRLSRLLQMEKLDN